MEETKKETKQAQKTENKKVAENKVATENKKEMPKTNYKKVEAKKETNKKGSNNLIIMSVVAIIVVLMVILVIMAMGNHSPKKVVEKTLQDMKTGSYAQDMLSALVQGEDNLNAEGQKLLFEKLEWKVLNEKQEGETATVEVEITNKDFKTIMGNYMQKALKAAISGNTSEKEMTNYLIEELRNEEVQTVTQNHIISLEKKDGKWEVVEDENFVNSVLPGLYDAINAFN